MVALLLQLLLICVSILFPAYALLFFCRLISNRLCKSVSNEESAGLKLSMRIVVPCIILSVLILAVAWFTEQIIFVKLGYAITAGYIEIIRFLLMSDPMGLMQYIDGSYSPLLFITLIVSQTIFILYSIITFIVIVKSNYNNRRCSFLSLCLAYILSFLITDVIQVISTIAYMTISLIIMLR